MTLRKLCQQRGSKIQGRHCFGNYNNTMKRFNYIVAVLFVIIWVIGFFTQVINFAVHVLLLTALFLILLNIIFETRSESSKKGRKIKADITGTLLFLLSVILMICWAIGFFIYTAGALIHILLAIAIMAIVLKMLNEREIR